MEIQICQNEDKKMVSIIENRDYGASMLFDEIDFGVSCIEFNSEDSPRALSIWTHNLDYIDNKIEKWTATKDLIEIHHDVLYKQKYGSN